MYATAFANDEGITLRIGVKDEIYTKSERMTFDVWARDENDVKIPDNYVYVTNNDEKVPINWSDSVKTSYTATLTEGDNDIHILVEYKGQQLEKTIKVTYEYAELGDVIGEVTFSLDAFAVGLGYLIEPIKIPIINGENAAMHLERTLEENGYSSYYEGELEEAYYLSRIYEGRLSSIEIPEVPEAIQLACEEFWFPYPDNGEFSPDEGLGEFDYNNASGWMYAVNNVFANVGFADYYLMNEDVMRVQFTVALGSDIGGGFALGNDGSSQFFEAVNRDMLTEALATINSSPFKEALMDVPGIVTGYNEALDTIAIVDISQQELDAAEEQLRRHYNEALPVAISAIIDTLPDNAKQKQRDLMDNIRKHLDQLTEGQLAQITNLERFEELENPTPAHVKTVIDQITALPETISLENGSTIEQVYATYKQLTADEQLLVTNAQKLLNAQSTYNDLKQVNDVNNQLLALPAVEDFQLENEKALQQAIAAYEALTAEQKANVQHAAIIDSLTEKLAQLKAKEETLEANKAAAKVVIDAIAALPTEADFKLMDEGSLQIAKQWYDELTEAQKALVENVDTLQVLTEKLAQLKVVAEKQATDRETAREVMNQIGALPLEDHLGLTDESQFLSVKAAYDALTDEQKAFVENASQLEKIANRLAELKAEAEQEEADKAVAKKVADLIAKLPTKQNFQLKDEAVLQEAQAAYDALTTGQQKYVENASILQVLKDKLDELNAIEEKQAADKTAAKKVTDLIKALPLEKDFTLNNESALQAAQAAYDALTKEQQAMVENIDLLQPLQNKLEQLLFQKNNPAVYNVIVAIDSLPETATLADEINYNKAQAAYDALTKEQQSLVSNADILKDFAKKIENLKSKDEQTLINDVIFLIDDLPAENKLTLQNETEVVLVEKAYNSLTKEQKAQVINYNKLLSSKQKIQELKEKQQSEAAIKKVVDAIASIPAVAQLTISNKSFIQSVRAQYDALTTEEKSRVVGIDTLLQAEYKIKGLEQVVTTIVNEISVLPAVITEVHRKKVEYLLYTYNALSISQKIAVTNANKLLEAEQQLKKLDEAKVETPQTNVAQDLQSAVKNSEGIVAAQKDEQANSITLSKDANSTKASVLSNELLTKIETMQVEKVVLAANDDINFEIPTTIFSQGLTKNASFEIDAKPSKSGITPTVKVEFAEVLSNGIKRDIAFTKQYVTVKLPLSLFNKSTTSRTNLQNTNNGVILRKTEDGYEAVPHKIENGEVVIFSNANAEYVYSTEVVTFDDIANVKGKENIEFLASRYVVKGYSEEKFGPNQSITRAQFAVMIARALNLIAEEDAVHTDTKGKTYEEAVQALYEAGITDAKGEFNPSGTLTRQHAASYMYRVLKYVNYDFKENQKPIELNDLNEIGSTHLPAVLALYELDIMSGKENGNFDPNGHLTRAQMAKILKLTLTKAGMM